MPGQPQTRARGYPRQPGEWWPGHEIRLQHGATSRTLRRVDPVAEALVDELLERRPELEAYPEAVMAWARAEARCILFADWHARVGFLDEETGEVKGGRKVREFEVLAANLRMRLGLDPLADAALKKTQAEALTLHADLAGIRAAGRAALERRDQSAAPQLPAPDPADVGDAASKDAGPGSTGASLSPGGSPRTRGSTNDQEDEEAGP